MGIPSSRDCIWKYLSDIPSTLTCPRDDCHGRDFLEVRLCLFTHTLKGEYESTTSPSELLPSTDYMMSLYFSFGHMLVTLGMISLSVEEVASG